MVVRDWYYPGIFPTMLWTILIILVIVALVLFIVGRMRGPRA